MIEYLLSAQPFSDGGIIELKAQVGKQDIANEKSDSHWPYFAKGGVGLLSPQICVEEVYRGVVDDIERIGNIAQPATDGHLQRLDFAVCPHGPTNNHRKDNEHAQQVVNAVPDIGFYARVGEYQ